MTASNIQREHRLRTTKRDRWRRYGAFAVSLAERARHGASYNPLSERTIQDPYPAYARLRSRSPVHRSTILGSWVISRYDDVLSIARDHHRFSNDPRWRNATASVLPPAPDEYSILLVDPPEHTRLRKVAARAFTKPKLTALAPTIEALADDIVERAARRGHVEWIGEVAQPLAMRVMLRLLGIAENQEARWQRWSADRARLLEMIATRSERKTAHITGESITGYFLELLAERARSEDDDAISTLAREAARAELINTTEAADMLGVIMIAGNETTANLIGNGLWALMRHPDEMERLREEPEQGARRDQRGPALRQPGADGFQNREERGGDRREDHPDRRRRDPADRIGEPRRGGIQRARSTRHRTQGAQARSIRARSAPVHRCGARAHGDERRHRERGGAIRADYAGGARAPVPALDGRARSRTPRGAHRATIGRDARMKAR